VVDLPQSSFQRKFFVGVGWDMKQIGEKGVDLDISAVFFHTSGRDIGAVYFDNTHEYGLRHTGDNLTGEGSGDDEVISVDLDGVPTSVAQIFFVVNIYTKDVTFSLLNNAYCRVFDDKGNEMVRYTLQGNADKSGLIIARLCRQIGKRWGFQACGKFCSGRTWMDPICMQDLKKVYHQSMQDIQTEGPEKVSPRRGPTPRSRGQQAPGETKCDAIQCTKGTFIPLPETSIVKRLFVGVGWDIMRSFRRGADLDVSVVFYDTDGALCGAVYFDNTYLFGVSHSGDNITGEGDGDDEVIQIELLDIPDEVAQMFVCVNAYTKEMTFAAIPNAYCRIIHESGYELLRYNLNSVDHKGKPGLVMCRFMRLENKWGFEATGRFCGGRTWMDPSCVAAMRRAIFVSEMKEVCNTPMFGSDGNMIRLPTDLELGTWQNNGDGSDDSENDEFEGEGSVVSAGSGGSGGYPKDPQVQKQVKGVEAIKGVVSI